MKTTELIRKIEKAGWYLHRHGANHDQYRHPDKPNVLTIPRHGSKEIPTGTALSILKDAGVK